MGQVLFVYPNQTQFGRSLPKNKIYEHAKPSAAVRELFIRQVEQIVWQYKLAPETINLPAKSGVTEIQIFDIHLKTPELDEAILRCIDKAIPYPLFFQLHFGDRIQIIAAYKRLNEADSEKWVVDSYFASPWLLAEAARQPLPVALNMHGIYEQMLRQLLPLTAREGEALKSQVERIAQYHSKQVEYQKLEARLKKEKQFNRKVEINARLRLLKTAIEKLESG